MSVSVQGLRRRLRVQGVGLGRRLAYRPDRFCFVSGSYRSGTTAVADWLGRQDDAASFSESRLTMAAHAMMREVLRFKKLRANEVSIASQMRDMLFDYYVRHSGGKLPRLLIDKEPLGPIGLPERNYAEFLGNVRRLFPDGRLVLMARAPVATLWSMTQRDYGHSLVDGPVRRYSLDEHIDHWLAAAETIEALAGEPGVYVCPFERLTEDPEGESGHIGRFLDIAGIKPFDPRPTKDPAFTAEELQQIETRTAERWRALSALVGPEEEASG